MRRRYLVAYDIREERRLRRVYEVMLGWGYRLQYSVFIADLSRGERALMKSDLLAEIDTRVDSVVMIDLGETTRFDASRVEFLGVHVPLGHEGPMIV